MKSFRPLAKGKGALKSRVLRLIGRGKECELNMCPQEDQKSGISELHQHYDFSKELQTALLEAEHSKAMGIAEFKNRRYHR
jgi:hypothetical protein